MTTIIHHPPSTIPIIPTIRRMNAQPESEPPQPMRETLPVSGSSGSMCASVPGPTGRPEVIHLATIMAWFRAVLETHQIRYYGIPSDQATQWSQQFIGQWALPQELSGRDFRLLVARFLHRFVAAQQFIAAGQFLSPSATGISASDLAAWEQTEARMQAAARQFSVAWARGILTECLMRMARHCRASHQWPTWVGFESVHVRPLVDRAQPLPYAEFARRFGLRSPAEAEKLLRQGRQMFGQFLRSVVAEYSRHRREVEKEIRELQAILYRSASKSA